MSLPPLPGATIAVFPGPIFDNVTVAYDSAGPGGPAYALERATFAGLDATFGSSGVFTGPLACGTTPSTSAAMDANGAIYVAYGTSVTGSPPCKIQVAKHMP